jgi:16S rRNA (cytidine1402-2'-O)-methyltransferase
MLWVVATPIGNLQDLSPRAREALGRAGAVLCEDTRRTAKLTAALSIPARLERFDAHSGERRVRELVERLRGGEDLALVTDAGTPGVSDPGARLVSAAREAGVEVVPVPGPSAVTALLSVSGFGETEFAFYGFFPRKAGDRARALAEAAGTGPRIGVWFESPERVGEALAAVAEAAPGATVVAGKELTKLHERVFAGAAAAAAAAVHGELAREGAVGEWCFAVLFPERAGAAESSEWVKALRLLLDVPLSASEAARRVSQVFGVNRREVYEAALALSGKKSSRGD